MISPDLTREDPGVPPTLDPATARRQAPAPGRASGVIYAIAPRALADRDIWVGTDDGSSGARATRGRTGRTSRRGRSCPGRRSAIIEPSPFDAGERLRRDRPPSGRRLQALRLPHPRWRPELDARHGRHPDGELRQRGARGPGRRGLLYAGTEKGVYVSFDDGDHWQPLQLNLPVTSVRDIDVHGADVVIATHGRGFWILDDVTPLRQATPRRAARRLLFAPATAVRVRPAGFTGTPLPARRAEGPQAARRRRHRLRV